MRISFCIPVMNRLHDLERAMPHMIAAANASPPVEIAVLDYNSSDGLRRFMEYTIQGAYLNEAGIVYTRYEGREHYHMAHAWNLAVKCSTGDYITIMGADAVPAVDFVVKARRLIDQGCVWMRGPHYKGIATIQRQEFIDAGGFDERFEFYGGEDKELEQRLIRRGHPPCIMPDGAVRTLRTGNPAKVKNFRADLSKYEMMSIGRAIREQNAAAGLLVANEGQAWGAR
jgi:hypothetical protein